MMRTRIVILNPEIILLLLGLLSVPVSNTVFGQAVSPIPDGAELERVTDGIEFGEGPLWHPEGFLLFSDVLANRIIKLDPVTGVKETHLSPSGGSNGLAFDKDQNLIMCRRDEGDIARLESDGSVTILASEYSGVKFNGPNDITIRSDGIIFFTDPNAKRADGAIDGVYSLSPAGKVHRVDSTLDFSNGITLSPDEKRLYVNAARSLLIYYYDIENDSTLSEKRVFARLNAARYLDGMKVDENGFLYVAGGGGVWIFSPEGVLLDRIPMSGTTTNLNWGDSDYRTLYITEKNSVHRIRLNTTTDSDFQEVPLPDGASLMQSYPNPFHTSTTIGYNLSSPSSVELTIHNQLGQVIRVLERQYRSSGSHRVSWDGRDMQGSPVANGVYIYSLRAGPFVQSGILVRVR